MLLEKFSDEKLKSVALKIKVASTICDVAFWTIFFASFSVNSYVNFAVFIICSYLLVYKKMGWMFVNWITWHELTREEKINLQKEDYYSIVRQMLENNLDSTVFVAHVQHLKNQENKEIELRNKEEVLQAVHGAGYEGMLQTYREYEKSHAIYTKSITLFFICLNALLFTYSFNGQDYAVANTPFAQLSMMNLILTTMGVIVLFSAVNYIIQFVLSPDDAPANCAQDYYLADFLRVISGYKEEFEKFKAEKGRCLTVGDMLKFKEEVVRN